VEQEREVQEALREIERVRGEVEASNAARPAPAGAAPAARTPTGGE
jgi:hypothetical protein